VGPLAFAFANVATIAMVAFLLPAHAAGARTAVLWLWPYAFGLATLGTLAIARVVPAPERRRFLARHFLLYACLPAGWSFAAADPSGAAARWATVYVVFAFAFSVHAAHGLWRGRHDLADAGIARLLASVVLVAQLMVVPFYTLAIPPEADEPHYLILAQSLALDRDLDLQNDYQPARYRAFYPGRLGDRHAIEVGSKLYPIRDLGLPILAALPFALASRAGVLILLGIIAALVVWQSYLLLRDLGFARGIAFATVAVTATTHPLLTYANQIYPDLIVTLVVLLVARLLGRGALLSTRGLVIAGALVGLLPWLTTRAWFLALGLAACVLWRAAAPLLADATRNGAAWRRAGAVVAAGLAPILVLAGLNQMLFGLALPGAGFYQIRGQQVVLSGAPYAGAVGLFFDRIFGLIGRAPIYLLAFIGIASLLQRRGAGRGALLAALGVPFLAHFVFIASLEHWHSDWAPASRNLVPLLPLLVAAGAAGLELTVAGVRVLGRPGRIAVLALVGAALGWSIVVSLVYSALPQIRYNLPEQLRAAGTTGRLWRFVQDQIGGIDVGRAFPSIVQDSGSAGPLSALWLAVALGLVCAGWYLRRLRAA